MDARTGNNISRTHACDALNNNSIQFNSILSPSICCTIMPVVAAEGPVVAVVVVAVAVVVVVVVVDTVVAVVVSSQGPL